MATAHRRSRKQFRTPLLGDTAPSPGAPPPHRLARCPHPAPPPGRAARTALLHTGATSQVPGGLFRRRLAASPQPAPGPGTTRRTALARSGLSAPSVSRPRRQARPPWPDLAHIAPPRRRGPAETPVTAPPRLRLRAGARTTFLLPARRRAPLCPPASSVMSIASHLSFFRGEDVVLDFEMTPPADITGWAITLKVADTLGGSVQFTKSATITDGPRGRFRVTIASGDTAALAAGRYTWDARRTDAGSKATLAHGELDLQREVTA